jgi:hypothetical protein
MFLQIAITFVLSIRESQLSILDSLNNSKISKMYSYLAVLDSVNNYFVYYPMVAGLSRYFGVAYE